MITRSSPKLANLPNRRRIVGPAKRLLTSSIIFAALLTPAAASTEPFRPATEDQVLERLPRPGDSVSRELRRMRAALDRTPNDLDLARQLAKRYISLGRAEFDPRYYGYAEAALKPWVNLTLPPIEIQVLRAVMKQNRHDFDGALDDLAQVLAAKPRHAQALLTQAFVLQVQGRYKEARQSCGKLPRGVHPLVVVTCVARIESLTGRADAGYALLQRGLASWSDADDRLRLWALTNLGEIAQRSGDISAAERHYRAGMDLGLRDAYLRGAYTDLLLDAGRTKDARELLAGETRIDGLLLRLALAESRMGKASAKERQAVLEARFAAARLRGSVIHRREEARFTLEILDRPDQALALAKANWQVQREPWDVRLMLEAALAAGAPEQARPVVDWLRETGLEDVRIETLVQRVTAGLDGEQIR